MSDSTKTLYFVPMSKEEATAVEGLTIHTLDGYTKAMTTESVQRHADALRQSGHAELAERFDDPVPAVWKSDKRRTDGGYWRPARRVRATAQAVRVALRTAGIKTRHDFRFEGVHCSNVPKVANVPVSVVVDIDSTWERNGMAEAITEVLTEHRFEFEYRPPHNAEDMPRWTVRSRWK